MPVTPATRLLLKFLSVPLGIGLVIALLLPMSNSSAQEDEPPGFSDFAETGARSGALSQESAPVYGPSSIAASLAFYANRPIFDSLWPGLPLEDFEATLVPTNSVRVCPGALSSQTEDACFALGSILPGLVITPTGSHDYAVLTQGFLGMPSVVVGPNVFVDDTHVIFSDAVHAVGLDFLGPVGVISITVDVYGPGNALLGSDFVAGVGSTPVFWGVSSDSTPIERLIITSLGIGAEVLDNIAFGSFRDCEVPSNPVANCSFETGDFTDWLPDDIITPFFPLHVNGALVQSWPAFFSSQPTNGEFAALHGFNANGPGTIELAQDVSLPPGTRDMVFDYRAAWDFTVGAPATLDRHFLVNIEPPGGGAPLQSTTLLTATAGTVVTDTGDLVGSVDLTAFAGTDVRLNFIWDVPEANTGPGFFQLDNVLVNASAIIDVAPGSLSATQGQNDSTVQALTISNPGGAPLDWSVLEGAPIPFAAPAGPGITGLVELPEGRVAAKDAGEVPAGFDCTAFENYVGAEPQGYAEACLDVKPASMAVPSGALSPTDTGYAQDIGFVSDNFVTFTLNDFPGQTVVATSNLAIFGMDFDETGSMLFGINQSTGEFGTIDLGSAAFAPIGPLNGMPFDTWTGLSVDPTDGTVYASSTNGMTSTLYTVDRAIGAATVVGPVTGAPLLIDIAVGPNGQMYGHDIFFDAIYRIDKFTGAATKVGPTGFSANFAQGMDFDNTDGMLYIFLYQGGGANVYGIVDLFTGAVTPLAVDNPLGEFEGTTQTVSPCAPTDIPWVSVSPSGGTMPPGGSTMVDVTFDSTGLWSGSYTGNLCLLSNDLANPLAMVPISLTVPSTNLPIIIKNGP